jgi:hypothetical protein
MSERPLPDDLPEEKELPPFHCSVVGCRETPYHITFKDETVHFFCTRHKKKRAGSELRECPLAAVPQAMLERVYSGANLFLTEAEDLQELKRRSIAYYSEMLAKAEAALRRAEADEERWRVILESAHHEITERDR